MDVVLKARPNLTLLKLDRALLFPNQVGVLNLESSASLALRHHVTPEKISLITRPLGINLQTNLLFAHYHFLIEYS